ncbi:MAG: hypothetical protein ACLPH3_01675 [Terracidiphilus sp.]
MIEKCGIRKRGSFKRAWMMGVVVVVALAIFWVRIGGRRPRSQAAAKPAPDLSAKSIPDLALTSPLNLPGGGVAPADAYEVYSALYQTPQQEPLVFSDDSVTDIPQVNGSCLQPTTPQEREMTDAFEAANRQSHRWEQKFNIPGGYRLIARSDAGQAQQCIETHFQDRARCETFTGIAHVRFLGVPGFDSTHTRALVSVVKMCGSFCGSGGIFEVEKTESGWRRAEASAFTRECSWMY